MTAGAITALTFRKLKHNNQSVIGRRKTRCIARFPCNSTALVVYIRLMKSLCKSIRSSDGLATFKYCLKSHLFSSAYHV